MRSLRFPDRRAVLRTCALVLLAAALAATGCSRLSFIKRRLPPPQQTAKGVLFQFYAPSAHIVQLCGNWEENNWCAGQAQTGGFRVGEMHDENGDGLWKLVVPLPPGRYQYKFIIDEQNWKEDPNNPQRTDDGYGGFNSIVNVE